MPVENATLGEEAIKTIREVVIGNVRDNVEEGESNHWWNDELSLAELWIETVDELHDY